jgi:predicted translin family RNA/ssDNA-binding protein
MLDKREYASIRKDLDSFSRGKIEVMKQGREVVKASKELIYAIHRGDMKAAGTFLAKIEIERSKLDKIANCPRLRAYNPYGNGVQEYVEAVAYYFVMTKERIPTRRELKVESETYLSGLSDLTGELMRKGVDDMINERYGHAKLLKETVQEIYGLILSLDLDGGDTRRKSDAVKWNLAKLEDLIYDAKIRDKI